MTDESVRIIRELLRREIGSVDENIYRAGLQKKSNPNWICGNGESIDDVIAGYQKRRDKLAKADCEFLAEG
jgi:hypothetical protein